MSSLYIRRQIDPDVPRTWGLDRPAEFDVNATTQRLTRGTFIVNKRKNEMLNFQKKKNFLNARRVWSVQSEFEAQPKEVSVQFSPVEKTPNEPKPTTTEEQKANDEPTNKEEQKASDEVASDLPDHAELPDDAEQKEGSDGRHESAIKQLTAEEEGLEQEMLLQQIEYQRKQRRLQLEREKARTLRRLCAPTKSSRARSAIEDRGSTPHKPQTKPRPFSSTSSKSLPQQLSGTAVESDELEKQMQLDFHRRPTRSYSAKLQGFRAYVKRPKEKKQYDPANGKLVIEDIPSSDESVCSEDSLLNQIPTDDTLLHGTRLQGHVSRVSSATHSSAHRAHPFQEVVLCQRHRKCNYAVPMATALYVQDPSLPLIAGLPRSKRLNQITMRNYKASPTVRAACGACGVAV